MPAYQNLKKAIVSLLVPTTVRCYATVNLSWAAGHLAPSGTRTFQNECYLSTIYPPKQPTMATWTYSWKRWFVCISQPWRPHWTCGSVDGEVDRGVRARQERVAENEDGEERRRAWESDEGWFSPTAAFRQDKNMRLDFCAPSYSFLFRNEKVT